MRILQPGLSAHLASGATTLCTCWRVVRRDGASLGFTDHDRTLTFEDTTFSPGTGFAATAMSASADLAVDNGEVTGVLDDDAISERDILAGHYDNAEVQTWRVNWANTNERALLSTGIIGEITRGNHGFNAEIRGLSHVLDQTIGRLYARQCDASVGDARCGVDFGTANYTGNGQVINSTADNAILVSGLDGFDDGWFVEGVIHWNNDAVNRGATGFVKRFAQEHSHGNAQQSLSFWQPLSFPPAIGDTFTITAGCDRRLETCRNKFSNSLNFRGFPMMPGNDFIISYPLSRDANDGGKR